MHSSGSPNKTTKKVVNHSKEEKDRKPEDKSSRNSFILGSVIVFIGALILFYFLYELNSMELLPSDSGNYDKGLLVGPIYDKLWKG